VNRTRAKAEILAQAIGGGITEVAEWEHAAAALGKADLLVNTTALGMKGQPPLDLDLANLPSHALVNDIVYAPLLTPLLLAARQRGHGIVTGIGMLLHQARPAFAQWFGVLPEITPELEALVLS
jgi:shikimate dehydrogenase